MSRRVGPLAALGLALALGAPAQADVVELTNGNEVKGEVVDEAADPVIVKTPDGKLSFPRRMVKKITREAGDQAKGGGPRPSTEPPPTPPPAGTATPPPRPAGPQGGWWERRGQFKTKLTRRGPAPDPDPGLAAPQGVEAVNVPVGSRPLKAWILRPPAGGRKPASVVWLHAGFSVTAQDLEVVRPLVAAGFVVFVPSFRGENGNGGEFELLLGELDDAVAMIRWFARQPGIDPTRIHALGYDVGGGLSTLLSLVPDVPLAHTSSIGGVYDPQLFYLLSQNGWVPFEGKVEELDARLLMGHVAEMRRPHIAWVGADDKEMTRVAQQLAAERAEVKQEALVLRQAKGDHASCVVPALADYTRILLEQMKELDARAQPPR